MTAGPTIMRTELRSLVARDIRSPVRLRLEERQRQPLEMREEVVAKVVFEAARRADDDAPHLVAEIARQWPRSAAAGPPSRPSLACVTPLYRSSTANCSTRGATANTDEHSSRRDESEDEFAAIARIYGMRRRTGVTCTFQYSVLFLSAFPAASAEPALAGGLYAIRRVSTLHEEGLSMTLDADTSRSGAVLVYAVLLHVRRAARAQFGATPFHGSGHRRAYHVEAAGAFWNPPPDLKVASEQLRQLGTHINAVDRPRHHQQTHQRAALRAAARRKKHKFRVNYLPMSYTARGDRAPQLHVQRHQSTG